MVEIFLQLLLEGDFIWGLNFFFVLKGNDVELEITINGEQRFTLKKVIREKVTFSVPQKSEKKRDSGASALGALSL